MFPSDLLEPNYADPDNAERLIGRTEVERRGRYFEQLDRRMVEGQQHPCVQLTKDCLHNTPSRRPTAEQLVTTLTEICLLYTSPSPRDATLSRMPSSA